MFAVKGWSVDATSLKPQTEAVKAVKGKGGDSEHKQNRKRKREQALPAQNNEDVGKLWDQHIEGKKPAKPKRERKKVKKESSAGEAGGAGQVATDAQDTPVGENGVAAGVAVAEKKGKKKRQGENKTKEDATKPETNDPASSKVALTAPPVAPPLPATAKLTPMQAAMRQKLVSARFRHLNETLYTAPSNTALSLFDKNPEMFEDYHSGFRQQVGVWPENPVDTFIGTLRERGSIKPPKHFKDRKGPKAADTSGALPRTHGVSIIADLGCGDARLASTLKSSSSTTELNLKITSYDLHSPSPLVTKADISNLPAADGSVDIAIFCLALMGTNWISFIEEAYRILHWKGELWVAEIKSRFGRVGKKGKVVEHSVGSKRKAAVLQKAAEVKRREEDEVDEHAVLRTEVDGAEPAQQQQETDVSAFVDVLRRRGFLLKEGEKSVDLSNKMFVKMEFVKAATPIKGKGVPAADDAKAGANRAPRMAKKKFMDDRGGEEEEVATEDEGKVLKPCLYKIR